MCATARSMDVPDLRVFARAMGSNGVSAPLYQKNLLSFSSLVSAGSKRGLLRREDGTGVGELGGCRLGKGRDILGRMRKDRVEHHDSAAPRLFTELLQLVTHPAGCGRTHYIELGGRRVGGT